MLRWNFLPKLRLCEGGGGGVKRIFLDLIAFLATGRLVDAGIYMVILINLT